MRNRTVKKLFALAWRSVIGTLPTGRVSALLLIAIFTACSPKNTVDPNLGSQMPSKILWAWERPEDLRFIDPKEFGVAFLAQTIFLENDIVAPKPRRQPLEVAPGTYLIAVTRIETKKGTAERPTFTPEMAAKVASLVINTLDLPDVKGIQIDFDAVSSEREFYRSMMKDLRNALSELPASAGGKSASTDSPRPSPLAPISLTMTSLASWCTGDAWFNDFPVDEAVPMAFQMGADSEKIKTYLRNGNDWQEPLCRGSYGISVDDPLTIELKPNRRFYFFKDSAWNLNDQRFLRSH